MALPTTPSGLAATAGSNGTVSLSWTANPSADAVIEYRLYRTPAAWFAPELVAAVATTSYTDASGELLPNTQWCQFVRDLAGLDGGKRHHPGAERGQPCRRRSGACQLLRDQRVALADDKERQ